LRSFTGKIMQAENQWYTIKNENEVFSPSLLVYRDRIENNILKMTGIAGDVSRLRPHVKTHKMPEIVKMQMKHGINKFKCATISEAEMVARCGATDILLAMQPVGPNIERFFRLKQTFQNANFSCIADSEQIVIQLSEMACRYDKEAHVWLDINVGMNRTGILPGEEAVRLFKLTDSLPKLRVKGLHVYDGHIHERVLSLRKQICNDSFAPVQKMRDDLRNAGFNQITIVAGGSPTFPIHVTGKDIETSPGTILLWDYGYSSSFSDMDFLHAAILFARVVSKPGKDLICLDLGHKAVGSEMPQPRIMIPGIDDYTIIGHNEEHMVIRTSYAEYLKPGDPIYAIPWHICPTVDRYDIAYVVKESRVTEQWTVDARKRQITI
jgi:D-serine deaminase-like pyridoxal phosphate-dependent protein